MNKQANERKMSKNVRKEMRKKRIDKLIRKTINRRTFKKQQKLITSNQT